MRAFTYLSRRDARTHRVDDFSPERLAIRRPVSVLDGDSTSQPREINDLGLRRISCLTLRIMKRLALLSVLLPLAISACGAPDVADHATPTPPLEDAVDSATITGGTFEGVAFSAWQVSIALDLADRADVATLDADVALDSRAAQNIVAARPSTMAALAAVPYVGTSALSKIRAYLPAWQAAHAITEVEDGVAFSPVQSAGALSAANLAAADQLAAAGITGTPRTKLLALRPFASLGAVAGVSGVGTATMTKLRSMAAPFALTTASTNLLLESESDSRLLVIQSATTGSGAITADQLRAAFTLLHDQKLRDGSIWLQANPDYVGLAARTPEARDAVGFFASFSANEDPNDPASIANADAWTKLGQVFGANLTDLTVIRFDEQALPEPAITASVFVVGRDATGRIVGVLAGVVET